MSSSGECELDGEVAAAAPPKMVTSTPTVAGAQATAKKLVYTRKKSASGVHRKISADNNNNNSGGPKAVKEVKVEQPDLKAAPASASTVNAVGPSTTTYLSPVSAAAVHQQSHHHHHAGVKPHHNHRHHHHHQSSSASLRKHVLSRRSPSPSATMSPGYEQYQMALLEVPLPRDYGDASSDDLSSEWDSDAPDSRSTSPFSLNSFKVGSVLQADRKREIRLSLDSVCSAYLKTKLCRT